MDLRLSLKCLVALVVVCALSLGAPAARAYQSPGPDLGTACAWEGAEPSRAGFFATCVSSLVVARPLQVGDQSAACTAGTAGQIKYSSGALSYCNGSAWTSIGGGTSSQWISGATSAIYYGSGSVGIGTTSPGAPLHIVGNWNSNGTLRLQGDKPTIRFDSTQGAGSNVKWIAHLGSNSSGALEFYTGTDGSNWTNVMSLTPGGNVGIGTTSPAALLDIPNRAKLGTAGGRNYFKDAELSTGTGLRVGAAWGMYGIYAEDGSVAIGGVNGVNFQGGQMTLDTSGVLRTASTFNDCPGGWGCNIRAWDISVASIYYSGMSQRSDRRLKHDITPIADVDWHKIFALRPVAYKWNDGKGPAGQQYGLIAQETEQVWPELVSTATDAQLTKSINYMNLVAPMLKALQQSKADNDGLAAEIKLLKARLDELEAAPPARSPLR
jgi:hypothetical protein